MSVTQSVKTLLHAKQNSLMLIITIHRNLITADRHGGCVNPHTYEKVCLIHFNYADMG
jgi:hypothetical protein